MSSYRLSRHAVSDIRSISDFIAADNPSRAASFIEELLALCSRVAERPRSFQRRDDLANDLRQAVHGRYLVLFTVTDKDDVIVERIVHSARRLDKLV